MKCLTLPQPLPDDSVQAYLQPYGFFAASAWNWRSAVPTLYINAVGHSVMDGHTFYHMECHLEPVPGSGGGSGGGGLAAISWTCAARVHHLRSGLYKPVKQELGRSYESSFIETPFARRMRPAGTTARLQAWCRQLAQMISARSLSPALVAATLRFLDAPRPGPATAAGSPAINIVAAATAATTTTAPIERTMRRSGTGSNSIPSSDSELDNMLASLEDAETQLNFGAAFSAQPSQEEPVPASRLPPPPLPPPSQSPQSPFPHLVDSPGGASASAEDTAAPVLEASQDHHNTHTHTQTHTHTDTTTSRGSEGLEDDFWAAELERSNMALEYLSDLENAPIASSRKPQNANRK